MDNARYAENPDKVPASVVPMYQFAHVIIDDEAASQLDCRHHHGIAEPMGQAEQFLAVGEGGQLVRVRTREVRPISLTDHPSLDRSARHSSSSPSGTQKTLH